MINEITKAYLFPYQVGSGIKSGANLAALSTQTIIEQYGHNSDYILFKTDLKNAFNTPDQNKIFIKLKNIVQKLLNGWNLFTDQVHYYSLQVQYNFKEFNWYSTG